MGERKQRKNAQNEPVQHGGQQQGLSPGKTTLVAQIATPISTARGSAHGAQSATPQGAAPFDYEQMRNVLRQAFPTGRPGAEVFVDFVAKTEEEVARVAERADRVLAPEGIVSAACTRILDGFTELERVLDDDPVDMETVHPLMRRLDAAMGRLFAIARKHRVELRETGLEAVFDGEDRLRVRSDISFGGRAQRADHYYDAELGEAKRRATPATGSAEVIEDLSAGTADGGPANRDELIEHIEALSVRMQGALQTGYEHAEAAINEPDVPKNPGLLERLAEMAAGIVLAQANAALGGILGVFASTAKGKRMQAAGRASLRERVGKDAARALMAGFKEAAPGAVVQAAKIGAEEGLEHANQPPSSAAASNRSSGNSALSPKAIYLLRAHERMTRAIGASATAFKSYAATLKRMPVETLQEIHEAFDEDLFHSIADKFRLVLVQEWLNFVKLASDEGVDMRDAATRDRELGSDKPTKLDNMLLPAGVVRIRVRLGPDGQCRFVDATLPGVSAAVIREVNLMPQPLSDLALHRRIELLPAGGHLLPSFGSFHVDPHGQVSGAGAIHAGHGEVASVAHPAYQVVHSEREVFAGLIAILAKLSSTPASVVKGVE